MQTPQPPDAPPLREALTLAKAVLSWSSPGAVRGVQAEEAECFPYELNEFYRIPRGIRRRLLSDDQVKQPTSQSWMIDAYYDGLIAAWNCLEADFRERLATSIYLDGVQIEPTLEEARRPIPQAWASAAILSAGDNTLALGTIRFASVMASLRPFEVEGKVAAVVSKSVVAEAGERAVKRRPGRPPFPEEDMLQLVSERLLLRAATIELEAYELRAAFQDRFPGRAPPAESVIRSHVTRLYAAAADRASTVNPGN